MFKRVIIGLVIAFIVIQFFHPAKNQAEGIQLNNISTSVTVPDNVKTILNRACTDCHSNNTNYPWYNKVQPFAWILARHIDDGKNEINFDEYATYNLRRKYHKMEEITEQIKEDKMPIKSYTIIHQDAKLSNEDKQVLIQWADSVRNEMKAKYPIDSLVRKK